MQLPDPVYLKGVAVGILMAAAWPAGTVWVVRSSLRGKAAGLAAVLGLALAQGLWTVPAFALAGALPWERWPWAEGVARGLASVLLLGLALGVQRSRRLQALLDEAPPQGASFGATLGHTWLIASTAPWRVSAHAAMALALGLSYGFPSYLQLAGSGAVVILSGAAWHLLFAGLAWFFGREVPAGVCVYSLNKLRPLAFMILAGLGLIALLPLILKTV